MITVIKVTITHDNPDMISFITTCFREIITKYLRKATTRIEVES